MALHADKAMAQERRHVRPPDANVGDSAEEKEIQSLVDAAYQSGKCKYADQVWTGFLIKNSL